MSDLKAIIQLRHGAIRATTGYTETLPEWVVEAWAEWALWSIGSSPQSNRQVLSKYLVYDWHQNKITELLEAYYG
jgi:hypothetical protein